ncbi:MAG: VTT domain-containing protein [Nanobdellota archaeon]
MEKSLIYELDSRKKIINRILTLVILGIVVFLGTIFFVLFKGSGVFNNTFIMYLINHVRISLSEFGLLGSLYVGLFGGLFFLFFPMEAYFIKALSVSNEYLVFLFFFSGIIFSYSMDYFIGMKFSRISKKLISAKKFYSIKSYINKFGSLAIFIANGIPFLPSQQVTFILGVFRYNKIRLLVLVLGGQLVKFFALMGLHFLFLD